MKILLSGGGSGGPVMPLLAVAAEILKLKPKAEFLLVGTRRGPEREMVEAAGIKFSSIPAAKWRRYFSLKNIFSPVVLVAGFIKALGLISQFRPDVVFSAGGFVGVPIAWAAWCRGRKIVIHQQDARIGLANKLVAPLADQITTTFQGSAKMFYSGSGFFPSKIQPRAQWVGNPVRPELFNSKVDAKKYFGLHDELPVLLILGGATGSKQINGLVAEILPELVASHQVVHQTGKDKNTIKFKHTNYHPHELIAFDAYSAILKYAHLVVARAGLSTIAELSALGKTAIVIPMPGTHQEDNGKILSYTNSAAVLIGKEKAGGKSLLKLINYLKFNQKAAMSLSENIRRLLPKDAAEKLAKIIIHQIDS